jgi:hypothetical protein
VLGDPTEAALLAAGARLGPDRAALDREPPRVEEIPFDNGRKGDPGAVNVEDGVHDVAQVVPGGRSMSRPLPLHSARRAVSVGPVNFQRASDSSLGYARCRVMLR